MTPKRKPDTRYRKHLVKKALVGSTYNQNANRNLFGAEMGFLWLGTLIVVGASVLMALRPLPVFGRKLSFKETLEVCWVAWFVFMGTFVAYIGLKIPLGLSWDAHAPAVAVAVCTSLVAIIWLARVHPNWERAVTKSLFGFLIFTVVVVAITWHLSLARH
jgi:hypothetical protein